MLPCLHLILIPALHNVFFWQDRLPVRVIRSADWPGSLNLHQAGLASELPAAFLKTYLAAVAGEGDTHALFVLGQWGIQPDAPPAVRREWQGGWQRRLEDAEASLRAMVAWALVRQALERATGEGLRQAALGVWRAGTKAAAVTHRLGAIASRFQEVRTELAAGRAPDFTEPAPPPIEKQRPQLTLPSGRKALQKSARLLGRGLREKMYKFQLYFFYKMGLTFRFFMDNFQDMVARK